MRKSNGGNQEDSGIAAVIFDWAGTIVDFGCFAPVISIIETFEQRGVRLTVGQARGPMGLDKREHIRRLLEDKDICALWKEATGADPMPRDVDLLYEELEPHLAVAVKRYSKLVSGARELADELHCWGIRIGTTTGYLRPIMDTLAAEAARQGFAADAVVCPSDVPAGRPFPWMCFLNAIKLQVFPPRRIVKIGDTPLDIQEGLNAGMWTIGVSLSGNEAGLSQADVERLGAEELAARVREAEQHLRSSGAHYVTESVAGCRVVLARIEERILRGEHPSREKSHEHV